MIGTKDIFVAFGIREKTDGFQMEIPAKSYSPCLPDPSAPKKSTIWPDSACQLMPVDNPVFPESQSHVVLIRKVFVDQAFER